MLSHVRVHDHPGRHMFTDSACVEWYVYRRGGVFHCVCDKEGRHNRKIRPETGTPCEKPTGLLAERFRTREAHWAPRGDFFFTREAHWASRGQIVWVCVFWFVVHFVPLVLKPSRRGSLSMKKLRQPSRRTRFASLVGALFLPYFTWLAVCSDVRATRSPQYNNYAMGKAHSLEVYDESMMVMSMMLMVMMVRFFLCNTRTTHNNN